MFKLDDGSGKIIEGIVCKDQAKKTSDGENPAKVGERWSVWGYLERPAIEPKDAPLCIWTARSHMTKVQ